MTKVLRVHDKDPNFPVIILDKIKEFMNNPDVLDHPENYAELIYEMKTEAALITNNSPYAEVRAVVDNTDDVNMLAPLFDLGYVDSYRSISTLTKPSCRSSVLVS